MHELIEELRRTERKARGPVIERLAANLDEAGWSEVAELVVDDAINEDLRAALAGCLGKSGQTDRINSLFDMLQAEKSEWRTAACYGLSAVSTQESVERLIEALCDRTNTVRNAAERSLLLMSDSISEWGFEKLVGLLQHDVPLSRSPAARILGMTGDRRALDPLLQMLQTDEEWLGRMWAIHGLGELGFPDAFDAIAEIALNDSKNRVRAACAEALGKLRHDRSAEILKQLGDDPDEGVRSSVREAFQMLGFDGDDETLDPFAE